MHAEKCEMETVSLIVLSKNEIDGLRAVGPRINQIRDCLHEIIMVDGGSKDGTLEYAETLNWTILRQTEPGIVAGLKEAYQFSTGSAVIFFTPDNNMIPEKIPEVVDKLQQGYDFVCVSRYKDGAKSADDTYISGFGNWMFTTLANWMFDLKYTDLLGLYKGFRKPLLNECGIEIGSNISSLLSIRAGIYNKKAIEISGDEPARLGGQSARSIVWHGSMELITLLREFYYYRIVGR